MRTGVLISQADCAAGQEDDFDDWYDSEHIPVRLALSDFVGAERYHLHEGVAPRHLVLYHLADLQVLSSPAYEEIKRGSGSTLRTQRMLSSLQNFTRYTGALVSDTRPDQPLELPARFAVVSLTEWSAADSEDPPVAPLPGAVRSRLYRLLEASPPGPTHAWIQDMAADDVPARSGIGPRAQLLGHADDADAPAVYRWRSDRPNASLQTLSG